jgi:hypothetical protein
MTEVHFCNLCDQSVPQDHLEDGSAIRHGGRILCSTCRAVMAMAATGQKPKSSRAGVMLALVVGLIGWGAAAYVWLDLREVAGTASLTSSAEASLQAQNLQRMGDSLERRLSALDARATTLDADLLGLRQSGARAAESVQAQILLLEKATESLPDLKDAQARQDEQLRATQTARTLLEQDVRDLRGAVEILRSGMAELSAAVAKGAKAPAPAGFSPEVEALLAQLRDPDPLARISVLEALANNNDPRLAPFVAPVLQDSYELNRYHAVTFLGRVNAREYSPQLVEALLDDYSLVRAAANEVLIAMFGQDLKFDPKGAEADRRKAYERWKQWLTESTAAVPAGSTGKG